MKKICKKQFFSMILLLIIFLSLVACNSCDLGAYKAVVCKNLDTYAMDKGQDNYTDKNWTAILEHLATGKAAINAAKDKSSMESAIAMAKDMIDKVPSKEVEMINQLKQSYVDAFLKAEYSNATIADVTITEYLGTYNGNIVAVINDKFHQVFIEEEISFEIDGLQFAYSYGYPIHVYNESKFYDLSSAFMQGFLTRNNIETIHRLYYNKSEQQKIDD